VVLTYCRLPLSGFPRTDEKAIGDVKERGEEVRLVHSMIDTALSPKYHKYTIDSITDTTVLQTWRSIRRQQFYYLVTSMM
jgi:hypothetical protein